MITEDYCSYEVAKLLKEKGFDTFKSYGWDEELFDKEHPRNFSLGFDSKEHWISCPTHQMAMKWLREEYGISIEISALNRYRWVYTIYRLFEERVAEVWNDGTYVSYEGATDDALKYCLENLNKLI